MAEGREWRERHRVDLSAFFALSFLKYQIYSLHSIELRGIKALVKRSQLRELINFIFSLPSSPKLTRVCCELMQFAK